MKEFYEDIIESSRDVADVAYVISDYCKMHIDNEDTARIYLVIKLLCNMADELYLKLYEFEEEFINKNAP